MDKVRVYRVELGFSTLDNFGHRELTQQGPYTTYEGILSRDNGFRTMNPLVDDHRLNPEPEDDGLTVRLSWIFGFKDLAQLNVWFDADIINLNDAGFVVSEYLVPRDNVSYGKRQVQFHRNHAELVKMTSIRNAIISAWEDEHHLDMMSEYFKC